MKVAIDLASLAMNALSKVVLSMMAGIRNFTNSPNAGPRTSLKSSLKNTKACLLMLDLKFSTDSKINRVKSLMLSSRMLKWNLLRRLKLSMAVNLSFQSSLPP